MPEKSLTDEIRDALCAEVDAMRDDARQLLNTLGYHSKRTLSQIWAPQEMLKFFDSRRNGVNEDELRKSARKIAVVFQTGDEEIKRGAKNNELFSGKFEKGDSRSFFFVVADLKPDDGYSRGRLARMTRAINRCFYAPAVVIFRHNDPKGARLVSLSFVHRRKGRDNRTRHVLGRVSILRGIRRENPHRGHLDILKDLALTERAKWMEKEDKPKNFDGLLAAWLNALDTETLNKRFYTELFDWFVRAVETAKFPNPSKKPITPEEQTIRLVTRLLFIWFIKEKGLVADDFFRKEKVRKLLARFDHENGDYYYCAILQNLFFATLNTEIGKRRFSKESSEDHRNFNVYRHAHMLQNRREFEALMKKTPFVNGGLFDCMDSEDSPTSAKNSGNKQWRQDHFSDPQLQNPQARDRKRRKSVMIPDGLFFHENGTDGIVDLLHRYKFTVEENTPLNQEVALDPELLGMVFENLLAAITPESRENARKKTGSYYTPRPVVEYMVDEALIAHLTGRLEKKDEKRLRQLVSWEESDKDLFSKKECKTIIDAIDELRILDPAVGSGAFPMGMLNKLVHILSRVDERNKEWERKQLKSLENMPDSPSYREAKRAIEQVFSEKNNYDDYGRKLFLIQNAIHGADLQPVAVQIARLRFFISLIIDQKPRDDQPNYGIEPLPNLETKFVAADSLIGLTRKGQGNLSETEEVEKLKKKINRVRIKHFGANRRKEKMRLRAEDKELRDELAKALTQLGFAQNDANRFATWDLYDQTAGADWFDAELMMGVRDGFDIIIGNPPYVQIQKFSGKPEQQRWQEQQFVTYDKSGDLYCLFYERGAHLLSKDGRMCLITSNKWMRSVYGKKLREFFASQVQPEFLLNLGQGIFDAVVDTAIFLFNRKPQKARFLACDLRNAPRNEFTHYINAGKIEMCAPKDNANWLIVSTTEKALKEKMDKKGECLKNVGDIHRGIITGCNEAFLIDGKTRDCLIAKDAKSAEIIKPILRGRDIMPYAVQFKGDWFIASHNGYIDGTGQKIPRINLAENYPTVYAYLESVGKEIDAGKIRVKGRGLFRRDDKGKDWSNLRDCAYHWEFGEEKLIFTRMTKEPAFAVDTDGHFVLDTAYILTGKMIKYLAAILNSRLAKFALRKFYVGGGIEGEVKVFVLKEFPIPRIPKDKRKPLESLVDKIIAAKRADSQADTSEWESEIDRRVYALYGLTAAEIRLVESGGS